MSEGCSREGGLHGGEDTELNSEEMKDLGNGEEEVLKMYQ